MKLYKKDNYINILYLQTTIYEVCENSMILHVSVNSTRNFKYINVYKHVHSIYIRRKQGLDNYKYISHIDFVI
jgi:hypothetical protein